MAAELDKKQPQEVTRAEETRGGRYFVPRADICENDSEMFVIADMPGVKPDHVEVQYEQGELRIHGRISPQGPQRQRYLLQEYDVGDFYRAFRIGEGIDPSAINAEMKDGVLKLHLPKREECKPKRIAVSPG